MANLGNMITIETLIKQQQQPKQSHFGKTGLSIKGKLASTKTSHNSGINSRKDSQNQKNPLQL
jgi:hypothetical protein